MSDFCIAKKEKGNDEQCFLFFFRFPDMQIQGAGSSRTVIPRPKPGPQQGAQDCSLLRSCVICHEPAAMSDPQLQTAGARDTGGGGVRGRLVELDHVALPSLPQVWKGPFFKASQDESHQGEC